MCTRFVFTLRNVQLKKELVGLTGASSAEWPLVCVSDPVSGKKIHQ